MTTTTQDGLVKDSRVVCVNSDGMEVHARLARLARQEAVLEIAGAEALLRVSEVLTQFTIFIGDREVYSGRAVVSHLIHAGATVLCQARLEDAWLEVDLLRLAAERGRLQAGFDTLIRGWEKFYRVRPEYKVVVGDLQTFLADARHWTEQVELGLPASPEQESAEADSGIVEQIEQSVRSCLNPLFEKFEFLARQVEADQRPAHSVYAQRQLHSSLLCSPFMHRIYRKPLGYAGDYEMVNMILRDPHEGDSLFARVLNRWFLSQVPAQAHRNRIQWLTRRLTEETLRVRPLGQPLRVYNLGCGPAREVSDFMEQSELSNLAEFTLLDFNGETLDYARATLGDTRRKAFRRTRLEFVQKSVAQAMKNGGRHPPATYDFVYCAGLFDYLTDRACRQLIKVFYAMLAPGGTLVVTNVDAGNPIQHIMGNLFEWHLFYRTAAEMAALAPDCIPRAACKITTDATGCNVFLEARKPAARPEAAAEPAVWPAGRIGLPTPEPEPLVLPAAEPAVAQVGNLAMPVEWTPAEHQAWLSALQAGSA